MLRDTDLVSIQEVRAKVEQAYGAFQQTRNLPQEKIDAIVEAMGAAARANAQRLAEMAVEETGYGNAKDKLSKNLLAADLLVRAVRGMKTVGVLRELADQKIVEIGVPAGVVAAILPTTNPTSTAIYKTIIAIKAGNAVVVSPHPRAKACSCESVRVMAEAALAAGAPPGSIQCIQNATMEGTDELMRHPRTSVILATGGAGIVKAAYSSGKPAYGVGPGNVPVLLEQSANVDEAIAKVILGKSFDYGTVCSSEQAVVALADARPKVLEALQRGKAFLCSEEQGKALAKLLIAPNWRINPNCVGQAPAKLAGMAGFEVPAGTSILAVEIRGIGKEHPLSMEKLSPVLSLLFVKDWEEQIRSCQALLKFGGLGHTCAIYSNDNARIREFGLRMPAFRALVNTPTPQGSTGITTNVFPAMTLGCGAMAGNATSDNISPLHLINIKRLASVSRTVEEAFPEAAPVSAGEIRPMLTAAVERYLAQRGIAASGASVARESSAAQAVSVAGAPNAAAIVDKFLAGRAQPAPSAGASCGCGPTPAPAATPEPEPPPPELVISAFVCEADVRAALAQSRKIHVGPKSIVTPSARDLAAAHSILVMTSKAPPTGKSAGSEE